MKQRVLNKRQYNTSRIGMYVTFACSWPSVTSLQKQPVFFRPALSDIDNIDCRLAEYWTLRFADTTTNTEFEVHVRLFKGHDFPIPVANAFFLKPDCFLRRGADFFADNAGTRMRPGQAPAGVDHGKADFNFHLFFKRQLLNRIRGTDLATEGATILAVTDARHEYGRPDALHTRFEQRRLKPVRDADFHALAAFDAPF